MADHVEHDGTLVAAARIKPSSLTSAADGRQAPPSMDIASGWLGDADPASETVRLTELQQRQRLNGIAPSETNGTPRQLLSLFRER